MFLQQDGFLPHYKTCLWKKVRDVFCMIMRAGVFLTIWMCIPKTEEGVVEYSLLYSQRK